MSSSTENLIIVPASADASCDVHDWPTDGMAARLVLEMRRKYGRGGVNTCRDCIARAHRDAIQRARVSVPGLLAMRSSA